MFSYWIYDFSTGAKVQILRDRKMPDAGYRIFNVASIHIKPVMHQS